MKKCLNESMKPMMTNREIRIFEATLLDKGRNGKTISVLEWGSGGSTVYFTDFLKKNSIPYLWKSIEYNKSWYEKIIKLIEHDISVSMKLFDVGNFGLKQRNTNMDEYVAYPATLGEKFDIILVDGRKRRRCLIEASKMIKDEGVVFLHDAQRKYYHCAFALYDNYRFVSVNMWRGDKSKIHSSRKILYRCMDIFFDLYFNFVLNPFREFIHFCGRVYRKVFNIKI